MPETPAGMNSVVASGTQALLERQWQPEQLWHCGCWLQHCTAAALVLPWPETVCMLEVQPAE